MTIYATPGSTPLNTPGFQGTAPGLPGSPVVQAVNPGVGMFPPGSNNNSGDSVMAAISRGAVPANVNVTNFGVTAHAGAGPNTAGGRALLETFSDGDENGSSPAFVANGGSANQGAAGGNSLGAGGLNQTNSPVGGETIQLPANAPASVPSYGTPVYRG